MSVYFNNIQPNIRVPLFYAEFDNSMAGTFSQNQKALLIGQSLKSVDYNVPIYISSEAQAAEKFGKASQLTAMVKAFRKNNTLMEIHCLPLADAASAVKAAGKLTITGTAASAGVISLYIAGQLISVSVTAGDTAETIAEAIVRSIAEDEETPVEAEIQAGEGNENIVTLTAKWKGISGNDIAVSLNNGGTLAGEQTPEGIAIDIEAMSGGMLNPSLDEAFANIGDEEYDFISMGYTDANSLNACKELMNGKTGRWSYASQIYGHVFTAVRATVAESQTLGKTRNDEHMTILSYDGSDTPPWVVSAAYVGTAASSLSIDPARPLQTLSITGMQAPPIFKRFSFTERNSLLFSGISTFFVQSGTCQIERLITTYQKNAYGQADNSYLDVETMYTSMYVVRYLRNRIETKFGRSKLADNGTHFGPGQKIVTPDIIRAELICAYQELEELGLVENADGFKDALIVERDANDRNRINILLPPDFINQLRVFAMLVQFRL